MTNLRILHLSPQLPPTIGGIADYTAILSERLMEVTDGAVELVLIQAGINGSGNPESAFRSMDLGGQCEPDWLTNAIHQLAKETDAQTVVLLQYSGYGYAPRGAPLWLLQALQQACGEGGVPLVTMFHELYATGPPWTSAFWLSPAQRYVAAQLARLSQAIVTNRPQSATWLRRYVPSETPVRIQPVFSNVGEPEHVPSWEEREPYAVVFGSANKKERLYTALTPDQIYQIESVGVSHILDIGSTGAAPSHVHGLPIEERGIQPVEAIVSIFSSARAGLLSYPVDYLTKSGIWSSYVAHGMLPMVLSPHRKTEIVHEGEHFIRLHNDPTPITRGKAQSIATKATTWYQESASSGTAASIFLRSIREACPLWI